MSQESFDECMGNFQEEDKRDKYCIREHYSDKENVNKQ